MRLESLGLPVGPEASAMLASAVLSDADDAIESEGVLHVRWVDDFLIRVRDERHGERT